MSGRAWKVIACAFLAAGLGLLTVGTLIEPAWPAEPPVSVHCDFKNPPWTDGVKTFRCVASIGGVTDVGNTPEEAIAAVKALRDKWLREGHVHDGTIGWDGRD